jgi:hypothetical protein
MVTLVIFWMGSLQERGNTCQEVIQAIHFAGLNIRPVTRTRPRLPLLPTIPSVYTLLTPQDIPAAFDKNDGWRHRSSLANATYNVCTTSF